jgi:hypothetical protein
MCDVNECIICFTDISTNNYIKLDCCKQIVHIDCLNTWTRTNINNKEITKCFHCKKNNDYINTIIYYINEENNHEYESDNNSVMIEIDSDYIIADTNTNTIYEFMKISIKTMICTGFFIIILDILYNKHYYKIK